VETKRKADELTRQMRKDGWPALCIHGDKNQNEREWVLNEFKEGKTPILLATDVAARGLDVSDIKYVINYDYPNNSEDYVHRIGRTGRRDKKGTSYTFFTSGNAPKAKDLIKVLQEANQIIPDELSQFSMHSSSNFGGRNRGGGGARSRGGGKREADRYGGGPPIKRRFDDNNGGGNSWGSKNDFGSRW